MTEKSRREIILDYIDGMVTKFLYYDRKECEDLPVGSIEDAIKKGEISIDQIADRFREHLAENT